MMIRDAAKGLAETTDVGGDSPETVLILAIAGLVATLIAGLGSPLVQSWANRKAERKSRLEREKLEMVRSIIDDLGEIAEVNRIDEPKSWNRISSRLARTSTNLELILAKKDLEISSVISVSTMLIDRGNSRLSEAQGRLNEFALMQFIKNWYFGDTKAEGLLSKFLDSSHSIRDSLLRGVIEVNGSVIFDDELTPKELEERNALGVSCPRPSQASS